jgi:Asp-tRNA(Asn)/Glu-tRNA(Gln) amidotransferase A subunit family amidase
MANTAVKDKKWLRGRAGRGGGLIERSVSGHIAAGERMPDATMLSALDLARRIEAGELTPAAVIDLCAEAIAAREAEIGAFVALDVAGARQRAQASAQALKSGPLCGLPVGVKDIFDTADFPTEYGSPIYAGHQPAGDCAAVSLLRRAGGLVLGKTVTTEFAHMQPGKTRNPRNLEHTPGGSSSGSAAAVAAGMAPIATGTQTGGSVIRPAAYCGVAGFKPSYRLLPTVGIKCFSWSLDTVGLFAAGVADVAFATAAFSERDLRVDRQAPGTPSIAIVRTHLWDQASDAMHDAVEKAARAAEAAGARIEELTLPPSVEEAYRAHSTIMNYEAFRALAFEYDQRRDLLGPLLRKLLDDAAKISADDYDAARRTTKRARHAVNELLGEAKFILTPSAPGAAPRGLSSTGKPIFNSLWTLMGVPCVNVAGFSDDAGMPLGVQIIGRFGRDRATLEAALFVEKAIAAAI